MRLITRKFATITAILMTLLAACGPTEQLANIEGADTVYTNGLIYTVDENNPWAEAVAITDGKISYVGTASEITEFIGIETKIIDLKGRLMMPAFQDSHIHPVMSGIQALNCDLSDLDDLEIYRKVIANYAKANPDMDWILGGGWSMPVFGAGGAPSKTILDQLVPDRPVYLTSADGHSGWANSLALKIAGITKDTPNPADGIIDRDPVTGELIGSLQEGAMEMMDAHLPEASLEMRISGLSYTRDMLHKYGITSVQDASVVRDDLEAYEALDLKGELNLRVVASQWWDRKLGLEQIPGFIARREQFTKGHIDAATVKIMQDGVLENYTAAMIEPYLRGGGTKGIPMVEPELLKSAVAALDKEGFQIHFHAIGDMAIRQTLDAVEHSRELNGDLGHRHHISHLQVIHPDDIPRFAGLNVTANFQPLWANADEYVLELNVPDLGNKRVSWMYPIKSLENTGARIAFGSDWSVSTANPYAQMETAITRLGAFDEPYPEFTPEERISLSTAIKAFTINAAYLNRHDDETGSITVGKFADLIVLNKNLFEINPNEISETKVLLTLFSGKPVYGDVNEF